jgi:hypothetical protein
MEHTFFQHLRIPVYFENHINQPPYINGFSSEALATHMSPDPNWTNNTKVFYGHCTFDTLFITIDQIPESTKFYYPMVAVFGTILNIIDTVNISDQVIDTIKSGQCRILCFGPYEGWDYNWFWKKYINAIQRKYNLNDSHFILVDGGYLDNNPVTRIPYNVWEETFHADFYRRGIERICDIRPNKFICLNRRPSSHRFAMVTGLFPYKDMGILTMAKNAGYNDDFRNSSEDTFFREFPTLKDYYLDNVKSNIPLIYKHDIIDPEIDNPNFDDQVDKFHQSYLQIITETHYRNNTLFLSEKIFKPICHCQPFVVFGNPKTLELLRSLGYATFSNWIDESYDEELDPEKKYYKIMSSITEFINRSPDELTSMIVQMKHIFDHNYENLVRRQKSDIMLTLLSRLRNELYKK